MADAAWIQERIAKTKAMIVAYEDAIFALSTGAQSYSMDTGQTRVTKTQAELGSMRVTLEKLISTLSTWEQMLSSEDGGSGGGAYVVPGF